MPTEAPLRHSLEFLRIDPFAGRAAEHELFRPDSKSRDGAEVLHGVAAAAANDGRAPVRYQRRALDDGSWGLAVRHTLLR